MIDILLQCFHTKTLSLPDMQALHSQHILAAYTTSPNNSEPSFIFLPSFCEQHSVDNRVCSHSWRIQKIERYKDSLWLPGGILKRPIFKIVVWCFFLCFASVSKETYKNAVTLQIHPQTRAALNAAPLIALKCKYMHDFLSLTTPEQPFPSKLWC